MRFGFHPKQNNEDIKGQTLSIKPPLEQLQQIRQSAGTIEKLKEIMSPAESYVFCYLNDLHTKKSGTALMENAVSNGFSEAEILYSFIEGGTFLEEEAADKLKTGSSVAELIGVVFWDTDEERNEILAPLSDAGKAEEGIAAPPANQDKPPISAEFIVCLITPREKRNELLGLLEEDFHDHVEKFGQRGATVLYWKEVGRSILPVLVTGLRWIVRYKVLSLGIYLVKKPFGYILERVMHGVSARLSG